MATICKFRDAFVRKGHIVVRTPLSRHNNNNTPGSRKQCEGDNEKISKAVPQRLARRCLIVKTQSNVRKERRKHPDRPCIRCEGNGKVNCRKCRGRGRTNLIHLTMLPKGEWPIWCKNCGGGGLVYCAPCLGTGENRGSGLIFGFEFLQTEDGTSKKEDVENRPDINQNHMHD